MVMTVSTTVKQKYLQAKTETGVDMYLAYFNISINFLCYMFRPII